MVITIIKNNFVEKLDLNYFAEILKVSTDTFDSALRDKIEDYNLIYELCEKDEEQLLIKALDTIFTDKQKIGVAERKDVWFNGWNENYKNFAESSDFKDLVPKYVVNNDVKPFRLNQKYIKSNIDLFEMKFYEIYREWIFKNYFNGFDNYYEFGCGTGHNILALNKIYPQTNIIGTDFVDPPSKILNLIGKKFGLNISGDVFDMKQPNKNFEIKPNSLIYTCGSIEQINSEFHNFFDYLFEKKPKRCVHIEPVIELYDQENLIDYVASLYYSKRGYTAGMLPHLQNLELDKKIKILKITRPYFGSFMMEGFNLIVWEII